MEMEMTEKLAQLCPDLLMQPQKKKTHTQQQNYLSIENNQSGWMTQDNTSTLYG